MAFAVAAVLAILITALFVVVIVVGETGRRRYRRRRLGKGIDSWTDNTRGRKHLLPLNFRGITLLEEQLPGARQTEAREVPRRRAAAHHSRGLSTVEHSYSLLPAASGHL